MLPIGEFSKICEVTPKTLRYYEEIGLIFPEQINTENGYRYYSIKQLEIMLLINRLKSYHFSLDEIKSMLYIRDQAGEEKLFELLCQKKRSLQEKTKALEDTISHIDFDMLQLKQGKSIMSYLLDIDVKLVENQPMNILYIRRKLTKDECLLGYGRFFCRLYQKITMEKLTVVGKPITIFHNPDYNPFEYDIEFAIPIKEVITETRNFESGLCIKSTLLGAYTNITSIYTRQREWAEENGYEFVKVPFEVYEVEPNLDTSPADYVTEIFYPVRKRRTYDNKI